MKQADIIKLAVPQQAESSHQEIPQVDELSSAILSLIQKLRDKDPLKQID